MNVEQLKLLLTPFLIKRLLVSTTKNKCICTNNKCICTYALETFSIKIK